MEAAAISVDVPGERLSEALALAAADLGGDDHAAGARGDAGAGAVVEAGAPRVVGVDQQGAAVAAGHQARQVVAPGVVRAQVATADQQQAVVASGEKSCSGA